MQFKNYHINTYLYKHYFIIYIFFFNFIFLFFLTDYDAINYIQISPLVSTKISLKTFRSNNLIIWYTIKKLTFLILCRRKLKPKKIVT